MRSALRTSVPILLVGALAILIAWIFRLETVSVATFTTLIIGTTAVVGLLAGVRRWQKLPLAPLVGIVFASIGFAINDYSFMTIGFFVFIFLVIWQEHQLEKKLRTTAH